MKISTTTPASLTLITVIMVLTRMMTAIPQATAFFVHPSAFITSRALASIEVVSVDEKVPAVANEQGIRTTTGSSLRPLNSKKRHAKKSAESDSSPVVMVQGGSLRTWSFDDSSPNKADRVQVVLTTNGRPLNADIDLWHGPDNTPQKMAVYIEDGALRPFNAIVETPRGQNTIAVRNTASMEYPFAATIAAGDADSTKGGEGLPNYSAKRIQGGAIKTYSFGSPVDSVQILLTTDGLPLNARLELLQGPNNNKQVIDVYTEDGRERPFYVVLETPGSGNVVRIVNTAPLEYPLTATVEPFSVEPGFYDEQSRDSGK